MQMAEWTQCPSCRLKHAVRADGLCPRCRHPVTGLGWGSVPTPSAAPPPAAVADRWAALPEAGAAYPVAQPAAVGAAAPDAFTVGRFISTVFGTWGRNAGWVIPLALALYAPAAVAMYRAYAQMANRGGGPSSPRSFLIGLVAAIGLLLLLMPAELLAIARAGVRRLQGEPVELGDMLGAAGRSYLPALGMIILVGLAYLGTACTIVLPFLLLTGWAASVPAMITEGLGPIAALKRSWELTRGLRWRVFAGFLVVALAMTAVACLLQSMVTVLVVLPVVRSGGGAGPAGSMAVAQASSMLLQGLESSVFTTATAVAYHQLRIASEGPAVAHLVRVFE
jgi:hypothetical protein